jgi:molybdate transport system substrate-binding protein
MTPRPLLLALTVLAFAACGVSVRSPSSRNLPPAAGDPRALTVYAAASLTGAFRELAPTFESSHPGVRVELNFAGSQELRTQIEQGARADIFAAADMDNLDALVSGGLVSSTPQIFARNRLVVVVPRENSARIHALRDLARPRVKLILAGPTVPAGRYTLEMLDNFSADSTYGASFKQAVLSNVVSQENNVKAVLGKVALGEADAGIVYSTDSHDAAARVTTINVPDAYNIVALYPVAVLRDAPEPELAARWIDFLLPPQGQAVLLKYGFVPPS